MILYEQAGLLSNSVYNLNKYIICLLVLFE